jgi:hypothetical protein
MSIFDQPASVWWSIAGPQPMSNTRQFWTLRDALRYLRTLPHRAWSKATVRCAGHSYGPSEFERLERKMRE